MINESEYVYRIVYRWYGLWCSKWCPTLPEARAFAALHKGSRIEQVDCDTNAATIVS